MSEELGKSAAPEEAAPPVDRAHSFAKALRNGLKLGGSLLFTWTIALGIRILIPRHLGPELYGQMTFADTFTATGALLLSLGADTYIRKEVTVRPDHASDFFGGVAVARLLMQLLLFSGAIAWLRWSGRPTELVLAAAVFSAAHLVETFNWTLQAMLHAKTEIDGAAFVAGATKVIWATVILLAVHFNLGLWAYGAALLASEGVESLFLYPLVRRHLGLRFRVDLQQTREALRHSLPFYVTTVAMGFYSRMDVTILALLSDNKDVGLYNAAFTVGALTMLLAPLFSWVVTPLLSQAAHQSEAELGATAARILELLAVATVPISLATGLGADLWMRLLFGDTFAHGVPAMYVLALMYSATYVAMVFGAALSVSDRGWMATKITFVGVGIDVACNLILIPLATRWTGPGNGGGGVACAISMTLAEIIVAILMIRPFLRTLPRHTLGPIATKTPLVVGATIAAHLLLRPLGHWRLLADAVIYISLALATGLVSVSRVAGMVQTAARQRRAGT